MDSMEVGEVAAEARRYGLRCKTERIGTGEEFEYKITFGRGLEFKNGRAAALFIDAMVREHKLTVINKPYRVGFGWEIF